MSYAHAGRGRSVAGTFWLSRHVSSGRQPPTGEALLPTLSLDMALRSTMGRLLPHTKRDQGVMLINQRHIGLAPDFCSFFFPLLLSTIE